MNIAQAKQELLHTLQVYLQKDPAGRYVYPPVRQRPMLLMGPPGVGKTAIVSQAAEEAGVCMVAYTMTHHTRQSAVGLPVITRQEFDGMDFSATEYTMSEVIASVYAAMKRTGKREGILFLDEVNCVSESLAPTMLQFLQNKTFGSHALPAGWIIVAAGNPPEYNKSVREFDVVTLDRVRRLDILPEVDSFLKYAADREIHGAVLSYLGICPDKFYHVSREGNALRFVTARGWEDLSQLLLSYEQADIPAERDVIGEFLQLPDTARHFASYYAVYRKYGTDYGIPALLAGDDADRPTKAAMAAAGDVMERLTVVNLILSALYAACRRYVWIDSMTAALHEAMKTFLASGSDLPAFLERRRNALSVQLQYSLLTPEAQRTEEAVLTRLEAMLVVIRGAHVYEAESVHRLLREQFAEDVQARQSCIEQTGAMLTRAFSFVRECFGEGQELLLLVSGLTDSTAAMTYISRHGCREYLEAGEGLRFRRNEQALQKACQDLETAADKG